jgi:predicted RNA polymerase sigma factor
VRVLQSALTMPTEERRNGRSQVEAAIAALHDDAASAEETDWPQILAWYDDLVALTDDPVRQDPAAVLGRAVAIGHVLGAAAGLRYDPIEPRPNAPGTLFMTTLLRIADRTLMPSTRR